MTNSATEHPTSMQSVTDFSLILYYWKQEQNWRQIQNRGDTDLWQYGDSSVSVLLNRITFESHWIKMNMLG